MYACHMLYGEDGLSKSMNPHVDPNEPGHPIRHELTTQIRRVSVSIAIFKVRGLD